MFEMLGVLFCFCFHSLIHPLSLSRNLNYTDPAHVVTEIAGCGECLPAVQAV